MFAPLPALLLATLKVPSTTVNHNSQLHYCLPLLQAQALLLVTTLFHLAASRPPWCAGAGSVSQLNSLHTQCQHLRGGCSIANIGQLARATYKLCLSTRRNCTYFVKTNWVQFIQNIGLNCKSIGELGPHSNFVSNSAHYTSIVIVRAVVDSKYWSQLEMHLFCQHMYVGKLNL